LAVVTTADDLQVGHRGNVVTGDSVDGVFDVGYCTGSPVLMVAVYG
jgi:hypothetical protein